MRMLRMLRGVRTHLLRDVVLFGRVVLSVVAVARAAPAPASLCDPHADHGGH